LSDLFQHEELVAKDKINKSVEEFTKDNCNTLAKIKKPTDEIKNICDIFLLFLDVKEREWQIFKVIRF
jgi:hypothetical protein